jgi:hypothetical protein
LSFRASLIHQAKGQKMKWHDWTMLIATVAAAIFGGLALLGVHELKPLFDLLSQPFPLWLALLLIALAVWAGNHIFLDILDRRTFGLKITESPVFDPNDDLPNRFAIKGRFDDIPSDRRSVWLITSLLDGSRYWPQGRVGLEKSNKTWRGRVGLGSAHRPNEKMRVILATAGEFGESIFEHFLGTYDQQRPGIRLPLTKLPPDVIECDSIEIEKISPIVARESRDI